MRRDPREERAIRLERARTNELKAASRSTRSFIEKSSVVKTILKIVGVLGVSLVMSGEPHQA